MDDGAVHSLDSGRRRYGKRCSSRVRHKRSLYMMTRQLLEEDASSSAAPPSDHPRTEGPVYRTHIRQSALYSNRPRRKQVPLTTEEHPSEVSTCEIGGDLAALEPQSLNDPPPLTPEITDEETEEDILQSRCPEHRQMPLSTWRKFHCLCHLCAVVAAERQRDLGSSLRREQRRNIAESSEKSFCPESGQWRRGQDSRSESVRRNSARGVESHPRTVGALSRSRIRQSVLYSNCPRRSRCRTKEHPSEVSNSELDRDLATLEARSLRDPPSLTPEITDQETEEDSDDEYPFWKILQEGPRPYDDSEESKRKLQQLLDARTPCTFEECMDRIAAANRVELAKLGILDDEETQLAPQHASAEAAQPLARMTASHEEDNIKDGKKWMRDEVKLCFEKHVEKTKYLAGVDFELDELCHQCFHVDSYIKVFHHYNFKIRIKMPGSSTWMDEFYFGEVKEMFGRKFYFCCPLQPNENGRCYACKKQGVEDLRHPAIGGFEDGDSASNFGHSGVDVDYWCFSDGDD